MKHLKIVLAATTFFLLSSCELLMPCLDGNGNIETEERLGGSFNSIQSETDFDVIVEYGEVSSVEVTSDENLLQYIETTVKNGKLIVSVNHDGCVNFSSPTEVVVRCPRLNEVTLEGSGNIEVYNFSSEYFNITHTGSGDITASNLSVINDLDVNLIGSGNVWLKGRAEKAYFDLSGSGRIDAEAMRVYECYINLSGSGNIHTYVYEKLRVTLPGSGIVYYYGNTPDVSKHITGSGDVISR